MKNLLVIITLVAAFAASGQSPMATRGKLTAAHFGNYNLTMLQQINTKLVYAADDGKLKAHPNEKLNYVLSADSAKQLRYRKATIQIQINPEDPYDVQDSTIYYYDQADNFNLSRIVYGAGKPQGYCLQSKEYSYDSKKPPVIHDYLFFKWDDVLKYLNPAEANWLKVATEWGKNPSNIDTAFLGNFARSTHRYLDSTLYHLTENSVIPTYWNDSLTRQLSKKDFRLIMDYEVVVQVMDDPNDPYSVHDSMVKVIHTYNPLESCPVGYGIVWKQTVNGYTYEIQRLAAMFEPYAGGIQVPHQPIAILKIEDVSKKIPAGTMAYLKDLIQHDVLVKLDISLIDEKYIELRGCR